MREIKFRAWDTAAGKMYQDVTGFEGVNGFMDGIFLDGTFFSITRSEAIPMQFTGLLDKNGKEIYEGDCVSVKYSGKFQGVVTYTAPSFWINSVKSGTAWAMPPSFAMEVIGNIYENPELLS